MNSGNRPQLPLTSPGCSCCAPANPAEPASTLPATAHRESPAAVVTVDADVRKAVADAGYALA